MHTYVRTQYVRTYILTQQSIAQHRMAWHGIALPYTTLHYITLHYITYISNVQLFYRFKTMQKWLIMRKYGSFMKFGYPKYSKFEDISVLNPQLLADPSVFAPETAWPNMAWHRSCMNSSLGLDCVDVGIPSVTTESMMRRSSLTAWGREPGWAGVVLQMALEGKVKFECSQLIPQMDQVDELMRQQNIDSNIIFKNTNPNIMFNKSMAPIQE